MTLFNLKIEFAIIPILISLITITLIKPSLITFLTSSKSERLLLSKELRILHTITMYTIFLVLLPIGITYNWLNEDGNLFKFIYSYNFMLFVLLVSIVLVVIIKIFDIYTWQEKKNIFSKKRNRLLVIPIFLIILYLWSLFGIMFWESYQSEKGLSQHLPNLVVYLYFYALIVHNLLNYITKTAIQENLKCSIRLENGDLIENAYFLHPTYGQKIILANIENSSEAKQIIVVPNNKIEYIEFLQKELKIWGEVETINLKDKIKIKQGK